MSTHKKKAYVKMVAKEVKDVDLDFVSLVARGANRLPFRIMKAEDVPAEGTMSKFTDLVKGMFGVEDARVRSDLAAVFVRKTELAALLPKLTELGISVDEQVEVKDMVVLKQPGFKDEVGTCLAISKDVGVGLTNVSKGFDSYPFSTLFGENLGGASFYPCLTDAFSALRVTIENIMATSANQTEAAEKVDAALKAFNKHVSSMVWELPTVVFKLDAEFGGLRPNVGTATVPAATAAPVEGAASTEQGDGSMTKVLKEAVAGDLDGLNAETKVEKTGEAAPVVVAAPAAEAAPVVAAPAAEAAPAGEVQVEKAAAAVAPKTEPTLAEVLASMTAISTTLAEMSKVVKSQDETIKAQAEQLKVAVSKAEGLEKVVKGTVVVRTDGRLDESFGVQSGNRQLSKTDQAQDPWAGVMTVFDRPHQTAD